jgi:hypothetical protein
MKLFFARSRKLLLSLGRVEQAHCLPVMFLSKTVLRLVLYTAMMCWWPQLLI